jgi:hypothetical protein
MICAETRFSLKELNVVEAETSQSFRVIVQAMQRFSIGHSVKRTKGDQLGFINKRVSSQSDLEMILRAEVREHNVGLDKRISALAQNDLGPYRAYGAVHNALEGLPTIYGYPESCSACFGKGKFDCNFCYGTGKMQCHTCGQRGKIKCYSCSGRKKLFPSNTTCYACDFAGQVNCSICRGSRECQCSVCHGAKSRRCGGCNGAGGEVVFGSITAHTDLRESISFPSLPPELTDLLRMHISPESVIEFGKLLSKNAAKTGMGIEYRYEFDIPASKITLEISGVQFTIFGLGIENKIYDANNLVERLLESDLNKLEAKTSQRSISPKAISSLLMSTKQLLDSKTNALIFDQSETSGKSISHEYVNRAKAAVERASAALYQGQAVLAVSSATFLVFVTGILALLAGSATQGRWTGLGPSVIVGLVVMLVFSAVNWVWLRAKLGTAVQKKIGTLTTREDRLRWHIGGIALITVSAFVTALGGAQIPTVQSRLSTQESKKALLSAIMSWKVSTEPDFQLRARALNEDLSKAVELTGSNEAKTLRAWQLLQDARQSDNTPDIIKTLVSEPPSKSSLLWESYLIISAISLGLGRDASRNTKAQAISILRSVGFIPEVLYWTARIQEQADPRGTFHMLEVASKSGHAHARKELAVRYANGIGTNRNTMKSKEILDSISRHN